MEKIVFATNNTHKMSEVSSILASKFQLVSLKDIMCLEDIPETHNTIEGNALQKARYVHENYNIDCFADDTGLEVEVLNGAPGVYSARYAGEDCDSEKNIIKLLNKMEGQTNRKACFRTVIALIFKGKEYLFNGKIDGTILFEKRGSDGFGYDPVFLPQGYNQSFAEMGMELKNKISHRALAIKALTSFLNP